MRVHLLGTGASDGWPNPWCRCASCRTALDVGLVRAQTSALVDGRLLLDLGPDGPRSALRSGVSLADVDTVLVTHAHPDHHAWPAWMWRGWAAGRGPLTLVAPPAVLADARPRLDDTVTTVEVRAGDHVSINGYDVVALEARHSRPDVGPAVLYDVTGPEGRRLLWGTDTGVLPEATLRLVQDAAYDLVALELTSAHMPDHLDLTGWPEQVAELRRRGAVTPSTRLIAIHLGHDNPPPVELDRLLAQWGADAPLDGSVIELGAAPPAARAPRRTLVLGGARSGKSAYAEQRVAAEPAVTYVATAPAREDDPEWVARVRAHVARRPASWTTVETGDVAGVLRTATGAVLVDDLGLWLTGVLDAAAAWEGPVPSEVDAACSALVLAWRDCTAPCVLVAPEVGSGVVPATASGRRFRDLLGALTTRLAAASDDVVQVVAGLPRALR
jgi:adenosylcobinamide kinase/adenosylcobinamide-phosphate guanylyltransferase